MYVIKFKCESIMSFIAELKPRNVFKVGVVYVIVAWLIVQVVSAVHNPLHLPNWFDTVVVVLLIIGFILAIILAWAYELTPEGVKATAPVREGEHLSQSKDRRLNYSNERGPVPGGGPYDQAVRAGRGESE